DIDLLKKALSELGKEYDQAKVNTLASDYETKKKNLIDYNNQVKNNILSGISQTTSSGGASESNVVILKAEKISLESDDFSKLSAAFKKAERSYNIAKVCKLFSQSTNNDEYKIIIQNMNINDVGYSDYVKKRKADRASDDVLKIEIKNAIVSTIGKILDEKY
ncbi:MAG TPA: hypothetical protein VIM65_15740, partial [Cyclobacteriaceae bacterium]